MSVRPSAAYHVARLLLLIDAYSGGGAGLAGLTKLAKLDFLLRYPAMLERIAAAAGDTLQPDLAPTDTELTSVESQMIRWKYGPWDEHYYPLIGTMISLELIYVVEGSVLTLRTTDQGQEAAETIRSHPAWALTDRRCRLLRRRFTMSGNALRKLIYEHLPEVRTARFGAPI